MVGRLNRLTSRLASRIRPIALQPAARRSAVNNDATSSTSPHLVLYEYEASPWCRLVREYATILGLTIHIRPCPRQTIFLEGAFDITSRFRPEAMKYLQKYCHTDELTFPLLIDKTDHHGGGTNEFIVIHQSHDILLHLWERYGQDVIRDSRRVDQIWNSNSIPFMIKFVSLASPTYLRAWPTCGLMQSPSSWVTDRRNGCGNDDSNAELVLHQVEGCPESRLVREALCTLEIPYLSIPTPHPLEEGGANAMKQIPVLIDGDKVFRGADSCVDYLWTRYADQTRPSPTWWSGMPLKENIGRKQGLFVMGAYEAFRRGRRAFVPEQALRLMSTSSNRNNAVRSRNILAESWSSIANEYDAILVPRFRPWTLDALLELDEYTNTKKDARFASIKSPMAICLCCGPGQELLPIAKILGPSSKVLGTDLAQGMVDAARRRIEREINQEHNYIYKECVTIKVGDAMKPPPGPYDVIFSAFGLQQLPCPLTAVKSWLETLKSGGLCVFIYWPPDPPKLPGQESCPFELWRDLVKHKLGTRDKDQEEPWDTNLVNTISSVSGVFLADRYVTHDIEWKDGKDMFNGMSMAGPWHAMRLRRGDEFVDQLGEELIAMYPTATALTHKFTARLIVVRKV